MTREETKRQSDQRDTMTRKKERRRVAIRAARSRDKIKPLIRPPIRLLSQPLSRLWEDALNPKPQTVVVLQLFCAVSPCHLLPAVCSGFRLASRSEEKWLIFNSPLADDLRPLRPLRRLPRFCFCLTLQPGPHQHPPTTIQTATINYEFVFKSPRAYTALFQSAHGAFSRVGDLLDLLASDIPVIEIAVRNASSCYSCEFWNSWDNEARFGAYGSREQHVFFRYAARWGWDMGHRARHVPPAESNGSEL